MKKIAFALAYCCASVLLALTPGAARAQATQPMVVDVTYGPGEREKTLPGVRAMQENGVTVHASASGRVCGFPPDGKNHIALKASTGALQARLLLEALEAAPELNDDQATVQAWNAATGPSLQLSLRWTAERVLFSGLGAAGVTQRWNASQPVDLLIEPRCLTVEDARAWVREARRVLRVYLGLPPS